VFEYEPFHTEPAGDGWFAVGRLGGGFGPAQSLSLSGVSAAWGPAATSPCRASRSVRPNAVAATLRRPGGAFDAPIPSERDPFPVPTFVDARGTTILLDARDDGFDALLRPRGGAFGPPVRAFDNAASDPGLRSRPVRQRRRRLRRLRRRRLPPAASIYSAAPPRLTSVRAPRPGAFRFRLDEPAVVRITVRRDGRTVGRLRVRAPRGVTASPHAAPCAVRCGGPDATSPP
jgi:hypothetical protein